MNEHEDLPPVAPPTTPHCPAQARRGGYIAILSVLLVSAIAAMIVLILFVTSLNTTLNSGDIGEGRAARTMADACMEMALLQLRNQSDALPNGYECADAACNILWEPEDRGSCAVTAIKDISAGSDGTLWRIRTTGTGPSNDPLTKYVEVKAYRAPQVVGPPPQAFAPEVIRWEECKDFSAGIDEDCETE